MFNPIPTLSFPPFGQPTVTMNLSSPVAAFVIKIERKNDNYIPGHVSKPPFPFLYLSTL